MTQVSRREAACNKWGRVRGELGEAFAELLDKRLCICTNAIGDKEHTFPRKISLEALEKLLRSLTWASSGSFICKTWNPFSPNMDIGSTKECDNNRMFTLPLITQFDGGAHTDEWCITGLGCHTAQNSLNRKIVGGKDETKCGLGASECRKRLPGSLQTSLTSVYYLCLCACSLKGHNSILSSTFVVLSNTFRNGHCKVEGCAYS
jgi:hypothetical protein